MNSFLIDCILCTHQFPTLNYNWDKTKTPVYSSYHLFWAHKYHSSYKNICEDFIIPLYKLIFLTECDCMFGKTLEVVEENGNYYLSEEGLYIRMFGGWLCCAQGGGEATLYRWDWEFLVWSEKGCASTSPILYRKLQVFESKECIRVCERIIILSFWGKKFPQKWFDKQDCRL